jgi:hypothetical protein
MFILVKKNCNSAAIMLDELTTNNEVIKAIA